MRNITHWTRTYRNNLGGVLHVEGRRRLLGGKVVNACYYDGVLWHQADLENFDTLADLSDWLVRQETHHHAMLES